MRGDGARPLADVAADLTSPFGLEDLATADVPLVAADLCEGIDSAPDDALRRALASVRAVTVAVLGPDPDRFTAELAELFDIVLAPPGFAGTAVDVSDVGAAVDEIAAAVAAHPQASVALVELLRIGAYERVPQGLVLESLTYSTLQAGPEFRSWLQARGPKELPEETGTPVIVERQGTALVLTLNRPARANAFVAAMRDALVEALRTAAADPTVEGVVIVGAGASFCSGGDLAEFGTTPDPAIGHATRVTRSAGWWIDHLAHDVRVHLHGHCIGAGIELPAFAGTILAAPDARSRLPEVSMGLVPGAGGTVSIQRRIGRHRTAWLALTGAELTAEQALSCGLVDRIAARD